MSKLKKYQKKVNKIIFKLINKFKIKYHDIPFLLDFKNIDLTKLSKKDIKKIKINFKIFKKQQKNGNT
jgi:hypothetical protein